MNYYCNFNRDALKNKLISHFGIYFIDINGNLFSFKNATKLRLFCRSKQCELFVSKSMLQLHSQFRTFD